MDEIGARLREARMRQNIDVNEVETRTKIRAKYLRAMENEEWDLLPGDVYIRSFLRTYGDFLGLDSRELLDDFRRRYENPSDHEPPPIAPPGRERRDRSPSGRAGRPGRAGRSGPGVPPWALVVVVLVVVGVVLYIVGRHDNSSQDQASVPPVTTTHSAGHPRHRPSTTSTTSTTPRAPVRRRSVTLSLVPTGQVYVCLVSGNGRTLIPGKIFDTGETIPVENAGTLLLTLGNASVTVTANGKAVPVAASSGAIGLRFTPKGHSTLTGSQLPTCT